ncbi:MAG: hypothetical protein H7Z37_08450 [Pyrinomonadaceae bacterium]|nr:hypothetical protein [Pyrinomonadaceae bacterium]
MPSERDNDILERAVANFYRTWAYGELDVTNEWREVSFATPLDGKHAYYLAFEFKEKPGWISCEKVDEQKEGFRPPYGVKTQRGEEVKVEAELIDEKGKVYRMLLNGTTDRTGVLFILNSGAEPGEKFEYGQDIRFVKMRVRSSHSFQCIRVLWIAYGG